MVMRMRVHGLREFAQSLDSLPQRWRLAEKLFQTAAVADVIDSANRYASRAGFKLATKAAQDVRVGSGVGTVVYGGKPYDFGAEYGSYRYRQFQTWRGNGEDAGYFFWPAIREFRERGMEKAYLRAVWKEVKKAFPDYS